LRRSRRPTTSPSTTEGGDLPAECFDRTRNRCRIAGGCDLQRALREAVEAFYRALGAYTLADLHVRPRKLQALLHWRVA
jgi:Rrf2 family iron-responsive transcriptional regulator